MTSARSIRFAILSFALGTLALGAVAIPTLASAKPLLSLHAFAVNLGGRAATRAGTLDIVIERWSTDAEAAKLHDTLVERDQDQDALLSTLQGLERVGYIRSSTSLGWDVHFARQMVTSDGSRRIVVATDRPMSFWEAMNRPRSADYAFTLAEIRLKADGTGEGKLVPAAQITFDQDNDTLVVENYGTEPTRLTEVREEK
jgi:hypothetical protein